MGDAAKANLRTYGIKTEFIGQAHNHIGSYFAEVGFGARPTYVTYQNRRGSSFGVSGPATYPIAEYLETIDLLHICGISLSLTEETWQTAITLAKQATLKNIKVCFDFNFRPSLNLEEGQREILKNVTKRFCLIVIWYLGLYEICTVFLGFGEQLPIDGLEEQQIVQAFMAQYGIEWFTGTRRIASQDKQFISGMIYTKEENC